MRTPRPKDQIREVYFVLAARSELIKIGVSNDAPRRMVEMQVGSPEPLHLMGVMICQNYGELERELHLKFRYLRRHGEWFAAAPELTEFIAANAIDPGMVVMELSKISPMRLR